LITVWKSDSQNEGIENPPYYFKGMDDDAIREFIGKYSPELVLN
jgi:hypothetical protein